MENSMVLCPIAVLSDSRREEAGIGKMIADLFRLFSLESVGLRTFDYEERRQLLLDIKKLQQELDSIKNRNSFYSQAVPEPTQLVRLQTRRSPYRKRITVKNQSAEAVA